MTYQRRGELTNRENEGVVDESKASHGFNSHKRNVERLSKVFKKRQFGIGDILAL